MHSRRLIVLAAIVSALFGMCVLSHAEVGDAAGEILETDIVTEFCGSPIPSFAIDGKTMIAAEDLGLYGYHVVYNDSIRCLFVTYGQEPDGETLPSLPAANKPKQPGQIIGQYYESDISVFINGVFAQSYALDGKMAICVEDVSQVRPEDSTGYWNNNRYGVSDYGLNYSYDNFQRKLSFWNAFDKLPPKAEQQSKILEVVEESVGGFLNWTHNLYSGGDMEILEIELFGTPHGGASYCILFRNDNISIPLYDVFMRYGIEDFLGRRMVEIEGLSGNELIYSKQNEDSTQNRFSLNLENFKLRCLE